MQDLGEKVKVVREDADILLKLYSKDSAAYFSIWLTSCKINFRFISIHDEDDLFYDSDDRKYEYLFWIKEDDWNYLKDEIDWED